MELSNGSDSNSHSDYARKPKKEIRKYGTDDSLMSFFSFLVRMMFLSRKVPENSYEFVSYFESAIQGDKNLRKEYCDVKNRHINWSFKDIVFHLIESFDGISNAEVSHFFEKLFQCIN